MARPEFQVIEQGQPLLNREGLVDLRRFEGVIPDHIWMLSDKAFEQWVDSHEYLETAEPKPEEIVLFEPGRCNGLITHDFGKIGKITEIPHALKVEVGTPYIVEQLEETNPGEEKGVWKLRVVRAAAEEDYLPHQRTRAKGEEGRRFCQVAFRQGRNRLIGDIVVDSQGDEDPIIQDHRDVLLDNKLPEEIKNQVIDGSQWIGEISEIPELPKKYLFKPHLPRLRWSRYRVHMDLGKPPTVVEEEMDGFLSRAGPVGMLVEHPQKVADIIGELPPQQQAVLARLWNGYWKGETKRRDEETSFEENVGLARITAWEGYKNGTIGVERETPGPDMDESGGSSASPEKAVWVHQKGRAERFVVDPAASSEDSLNAHDGNWKVYTAAEWLRIMEDDQQFLEYLMSQEGIRLHAGLFDGLRPNTAVINVAALAKDERYRGNGHPYGRQPIALKAFPLNYDEEIKEFANDAISVLARFLPSLAEHTTIVKPTGDLGAKMPKSDYQVGYLLEEAVFNFKKNVQALPKHVQERIRGVVDAEFSRFKTPVWIGEEGDTIRWLAGKKWENAEERQEAEPTSQGERE